MIIEYLDRIVSWLIGEYYDAAILIRTDPNTGVVTTEWVGRDKSPIIGLATKAGYEALLPALKEIDAMSDRDTRDLSDLIFDDDLNELPDAPSYREGKEIIRRRRRGV